MSGKGITDSLEKVKIVENILAGETGVSESSQLGLKNDTFIKALPMDDKRIKYLEFHHQSVYKGSYGFSETDVSRRYSASQNKLKVAENRSKYANEKSIV